MTHDVVIYQRTVEHSDGLVFDREIGAKAGDYGWLWDEFKPVAVVTLPGGSVLAADGVLSIGGAEYTAQRVVNGDAAAWSVVVAPLPGVSFGDAGV